MEYLKLHDWPNNKAEAIEIQKVMAQKVETLANNKEVSKLVAVETAYSSNGDIVLAAAAAFSFPDITELERTFQYGQVAFPYIPGMFFFREGETIIKALEKIKTDADLIVIHGHGIAHPQLCGMASHIGLGFNKPTVGCCRKLLIGNHQEVLPTKGNYQPITFKGRLVGYALRSKDNVKPIFISPGHMCDVDTALDIILKNLRGYRLPEPLRIAHSAVNKYKRHIERKLGI